MTKRRQSREMALQVLYAQGFAEEPVAEVFEKVRQAEEYPVDIVMFAREIVDKVVEHEQEFDQMIKDTAFNWDISRIAMIDKIAIRIALAEIFYFDSIPYKVSIDEAIELGKKFSTQDSGKFINGILDAIGKRLNKKKPEKDTKE
jgi:transcription antitermination protein NusB